MKGRTKIHITNDELTRRFNYHAPQTQETVKRHERVREACLFAATEVIEMTGSPTPEQTLAVRKLEEAMFWANAAIAREITSPQS